ncbi:MAG: ECF transporter S component [Oscillospiraceae bacterium]|nr:ECF transporter S component [Oscillospiraceae bacterium]
MKDTKKMVQLAVLVAIIAIMAFTPLGFLRVGVVEITLMMIPVAVAAIVVGPAGGAIAGGAFGITSFIQCFGISPFGTALMNINPFYTFILTIVTRILAGWIPGLIYKALVKTGNKTVSVMAASIAAPVMNTVLFVGTLILLFGQTEFIRGFGETAWQVVTFLVGLNALIELGVGFVAGTAISRSLVHFFPDRKSMTEKG